ncbi:phosphatidylinositol mannoside acyltransferase [Motilibacter sp. E257]|uniref:Phosphatidylinositol mannoside acyltransferase n=1 Tax=Motilibacter deserti TaxID=2714956 RepID=A0ABX0GW83_9ACTN|nr:phosphatidylinositol mannoside acyltransferase [Motilibacter deserti]NHC13951.1 phosphatidylinositol mannoside acyltransferase [Motilibacter deserti]
MVQRLTLAGYSAGWALVRRLPERAAYALFGALADVAVRRGGRGVRRLEANLRRAAPAAGPDELAALVRAGMRSYLRYWCDTFRMSDWPRERVMATTTVVDGHHVSEALAAGRGFIGALPHMGNWDHAGAWAAAVHAPVLSVAERLRPEELYDRFVAHRRRLGISVLPLTGGGALVPALRDWLRANRIVCLLTDRDLSATGVEVQLLGERARVAPGPAILALQTGAPLHPITVAYDERGIVVTFHPRVVPPAAGTTRQRVQAMCQQVADAFGAAITAAPQDWHMLQRVFVADLSQGHAPGAAADDAVPAR